MKFKEALNITENLILEKMTKEQQELGQREMNKVYSEPFNKLINWFNNLWEDKQKTKEYYIQRNRIKILKKYLEETEKFSDKQAQDYLKYINGHYPKILTKSSTENKISTLRKNQPYLSINKDTKIKDGNYSFTSGFAFETNNDKFLELCLKRFIVLHEYGHLFNFFKDFVIKGEAKIIDTLFDNEQEVKYSEGKANDYAIANSYRKDILKMLYSSDLYNKNASDYLDDKTKFLDDNKINIINNYREGTVEHSNSFREKIKKINNILRRNNGL